jgi:ABC-type antimicrobial peptide transport system permease subunit
MRKGRGRGGVLALALSMIGLYASLAFAVGPIVVVIVAISLPARLATKQNPIAALRAE